MVNSFYKDLFSDPALDVPWVQFHLSFPRIEQNLLDALGQDISEVEVKKALFDMDAWKAPGPDGFPAGFYQGSWEVVAQSLFDFAKECIFSSDAVCHAMVRPILFSFGSTNQHRKSYPFLQKCFFLFKVKPN